jgi:hypothetical protein
MEAGSGLSFVLHGRLALQEKLRSISQSSPLENRIKGLKADWKKKRQR